MSSYYLMKIKIWEITQLKVEMFLIMFNVERGGIAKTPKVEQKNKQTNKNKNSHSVQILSQLAWNGWILE